MNRLFSWFQARSNPQRLAHTVARRVTLFGVTFCGVTLYVASCDRHTTAVAAFPAGTVLALDGIPISAADVDDIGDIVARIDPANSADHVRRIALTNVVLPRIAGIHLAGASKRDAALEKARAARAAIEAGTPPVDLETKSLEGGFVAIGLEAWRYAMDAAIGKLSEPIETIGGFQLVRVLERDRGTSPRDVQLKVALHFFPYVDPDDPNATIEKALDHAKLVYVDETWRDIVPVSWQYRLRGESP